MRSDWAVKNATKLFICIAVAGILMQSLKQSSVKERMEARIPGFSVIGTDTVSINFSSTEAAVSSVKGILRDIEKVFSMGIY